MANDVCAIWGTPIEDYGRSGDIQAFNSPRAGGVYWLTGSATVQLRNADARLRARLTTWIVDQHRAGVEEPMINSTVFDQVRNRRALKFSDKKARFFLLLSSTGYAVGSEFDAEDEAWRTQVATWTECEKVDHVDDLLNLLRAEELIDSKLEGLAPAGFRALEAVEAGGAATRQAFVAQWFSDETESLFEHGIAPAIRRAGYEPFRIDHKEHTNKIDDEIIAEIRRSRFVVADFTCGIFNVDGKPRAEARGGVYYEAGFARGLGTPVIWTVRKDCIDHVHFDTRQFAHIVWSDPAELHTALYNRIAAVIGTAA